MFEFKGDLLIIDDSVSFCDSVIDLIQDETNWTVFKVHNGYDAIDTLSNHQFKTVLLDLKMPGMSGLEVLLKLQEKNIVSRNYIIVLTGEITIENAVNSLQYGARDFIQKANIVEYHENFLSRIEKGFNWQNDRMINEKLKLEKKKAIEESQLIVKSVGHDMSGSYYGSLMLRLQMLAKKIEKIKTQLNTKIKPLLEDCDNSERLELLSEEISAIEETIDNGIERSNGIIILMRFFKELGEKLKHLGNAIAIDQNHVKEFDLSDILKAAFQMLTESKTYEFPNVKVTEIYSKEKLLISASEEDLLRVFLNLIENAYKAMGDSGELTLQTKLLNDKAIAIVKDNGCGISENKIDQIWRPDYSSWENATGTGLGLMICKKVVENFGGVITVNSKVGYGTEFIIEFNLSKKNKIKLKKN